MATTKKQVFTTATADGSTRGQPSMVVTTSDPDRVGDRIIMAGARTTDYMKNPILCWSHDYSNVPIGSVTSLDILPASIRASWRWLEGDAFADRVKNAWNQGVIRSASIGFQPLKATPNKFGGQDIEEFSLLEISLCVVPMNPSAVRTLKALGVIPNRADDDPIVVRLIDDTDDDQMVSFDPDDLRDVLKRLLPEIVREQVVRTARETLERTVERVIARERGIVLDSADLAGLTNATKRGARR